MEAKIIEVCMGQMEISESPTRLITRGLGSCLGITLYDPNKRIGGLGHPMLPDIDRARIKSNQSRFVNSVIVQMVETLEKMGCTRAGLVAKIFGGAHMFSFIATDSYLNVGQKNIEMALTKLKEMNIKVIAQEVGGTFGRTVELNLETGKVMVSTVSWGEKEI